MNMTGLMLSILFGMIGMGYLMYGKKMGEFVPLGVGAGLLVAPYLVANSIVLVVVCVVLMAAPFILRQW
ncbi:MAG TPA: hypothetical protein VN541_22495 [Tepidisphaeraceae bacterium]|nr:hypothetical protein [Tepidisphaeraceae bacterium]